MLFVYRCSLKARLTPLIASLLLGGCATLPSSGPTGPQILGDKEGARLLGFRIVDVTPATADMLAVPMTLPRLALLAADGRVDTLGAGDVLSVAIFEVGAGLFSAAGAVGSDGQGADPSAGARSLLTVVVDREGAITIPYVGRIEVAGLTTAQVQERIQRGLRGMSQSPQALVSVRQSVSSTVVVLGAVARPGRQILTLARSRLLDAIAEAGGIGFSGTAGGTAGIAGSGSQPQDIIVRFTRAGRSVEESLAAISSGSADDLPLLPGDRIELIRRPQTYTVFGASRVAQLPFETAALSLAEAIARAGGPSDTQADPRAIFVFRYARDANGLPIVPTSSSPDGTVMPPTIYHLDLMRPSSYFLAQRFAMRDKDLIYVANARANQPTKLVQIVNLLFSPVFAIRAATR